MTMFGHHILRFCNLSVLAYGSLCQHSVAKVKVEIIRNLSLLMPKPVFPNLTGFILLYL